MDAQRFPFLSIFDGRSKSSVLLVLSSFLTGDRLRLRQSNYRFWVKSGYFVPRMAQARRARSPQIAQALGALLAGRAASKKRSAIRGSTFFVHHMLTIDNIVRESAAFGGDLVIGHSGSAGS